MVQSFLGILSRAFADANVVSYFLAVMIFERHSNTGRLVHASKVYLR